MKFWKSLNMLIDETLPDWRDQFLSYKDLKKQLKLIVPKDKVVVGDGGGGNKRARLEVEDDGETGRVTQFVKLLEDEIDKFNSFFVEKEEEYVIRWKELQDRVAKATDSNEELMKVGREIVDFHGEMVLLENYSALNYTGLVKILKKYDKRSGALIRLPFIQKVLQQPFYKTDVLNQLVKECEMALEHLFYINQQPSTSEATEDKETQQSSTSTEDMKSSTSTEDIKRPLSGSKELAEIEIMEGMYMKLTVSALRVLKEIRSGSSTVSMFSLPPLQSSAVEDWTKIPIIEQAAK